MRSLKYIILLIVLGFLIYAPVLPGKFVIDDIPQIVKNKKVHNLDNLWKFMTMVTSAPEKTESFFDNYYRPYRPLPFMLYALIYTYGNGQPIYFHLFQLLINILNTILLYLLFALFFSRRLSFFLALVFLIHIINQNLSALIANYFDELALCFSFIALLVLKTNYSVWLKTLVSNIFLFLALLSKESSLFFIPVISIFSYLFSKIKLKIYLIFLIISLFIYSILIHLAFPHNILSNHLYYPLNQTFAERLAIIPALFFYIYKEIALPGLAIPGTKEIITNPPDIIFLVAFHISIIAAIVFLALHLKKHKPVIYKTYIFFLAIFIISLMLCLQIFLQLDALFARRWLALPLIAALGLAGTIITAYPLQNKKYIFTFKILFAIYLITMAIASIRLNFLIGNA